MARRPRLSKAELELMDLIWERGESSVRELQETIPEKRRPAYTTVQTLVGRLEEKGAVRRSRRVGNAYLYEPAITRRSTYRRLIDELVEVFGGSATPIVSHLIESGKLTLEDLRVLEREQSKRKDGAE
ncbi:MAG TPA: BlaI/MecI/CopY family transcriptional regulator [Thermoanaerobaculia bacterium]